MGGGNIIMRKAMIAAIIASVTIGASFGVYASHSAAQEDLKLQLSEEDKKSADGSETGSDADETEKTVLPSESIEKTSLTDPDSSNLVADIAQNVMPAMVAITNTSLQEVRDWFLGGSMQYESRSAGTGVIMGEKDSELLIVTNNHVVDGADKLAVTFINDTSVEGTVKGTAGNDDLAVVAVKLDDIDSDTRDQIRIAVAADSEDVRVGEQVVAIGNALGYGQSVTTGIVSALGREVNVRDAAGISSYEELIQTDAAINAGNSGGALLNMKGEVIGINSVKASRSGVEGMGYAIPTKKALPIVRNLMNRDMREKVSEEDMAYIGITGENVDASVSQLYGLPIGVYLSEVTGDSPAEEAGLTKGMVITAFDGQTIQTMEDLQELLAYYAAGETVTVTVQKADETGTIQEQDLTLTLGRRADFFQTN